MLDSIWDELDPRNTILFIGSGFSKEAVSKRGVNFPTGSELAADLSTLLGYNETNSLSLREISGDFIPSKQRDLYNHLQSVMITKCISADQDYIIGCPWRRIYTTNYDDVFEFGLLEKKLPYESLSFNDALKKPAGARQVVHLHGYIHNCNDDDIDEQLVLTEASYVRQLANPRPWFDQFVDDIRFAQAVIFLGYSLADTPINALLVRGHDIREKTSFVLRDEPDKRYREQVSHYGTIRPIALEGFAQHLKALKSAPRKFSALRFSCFDEMNPKKDKKTLSRATALEIRNLLSLGRFNLQACAASWPEADYVFPREDKVNEAIAQFAFCKTLLVHSRSSNGKTVFTEMLNVALSQKGYRCIRAKSNPVLNEDDFLLMKSTQRLVLFFRTLDDATQTMSQLSEVRSDMHFVVELPTSIADVRANAVGRMLRQPFFRVDLNTLTENDKEDLFRIIDNAGFPSTLPSDFNRCVELRDFLLQLYSNSHIRNALIDRVKPLWDMPRVRRVMTTMFLLKSLGLELSAVFKRSIIGEDPGAALENALDGLQNNVHDIFDFRDSTVEPFSAIVSQVLLSELLVPQDIIDWVLRVAEIAAHIKQEEIQSGQFGARFNEAKKVIGIVLKVSSLRYILKDADDCDGMIESLFERARLVQDINAEPLFWLQFAILYDNKNGELSDLLLSKDYIQTAYRRAASADNFKTYQLDTFYMRLLLHLETHPNSQSNNIDNWLDICGLLLRFNEMLREEAHRYFVVSVLQLFDAFVLSRVGEMNSFYRSKLISGLNVALDAISALPASVVYDTEQARLSLLRARHRLERSYGDSVVI